MVTISAPEFYPDGVIRIDAFFIDGSAAVQRRVNRIATLDGGAVFNDFGFSQADKTIELRWKPESAAKEARIGLLVELNPLLHVATRNGFYLAAPEVFTPGAEESTLRLLVKEKLSA